MGWSRSRGWLSHHLAGGVEALDTGDLARNSGVGVRSPVRNQTDEPPDKTVWNPTESTG